MHETTKLNSDSDYLCEGTYRGYLSFMVKTTRVILLIRFHTETRNNFTTWVAISCSRRNMLHRIRSLLTLHLRLFVKIMHNRFFKNKYEHNSVFHWRTGEKEMSPYSCCPQAEVLGILRLLCLPCFPPFSLHISPTSFFSRAHLVVSNAPFLLLYTSPRSSFLIPHISTLNSIANPFSFT